VIAFPGIIATCFLPAVNGNPDEEGKPEFSTP